MGSNPTLSAMGIKGSRVFRGSFLFAVFGAMEPPTFCVIRNITMPAVLVEVGFIDSDDVGVLTLHGDEIARAIARGVAVYWQQYKNL